MPKQNLSQLRADVLDRDQGCIWPADHDGPLELVHLRHRGMGGTTTHNNERDCVIMCRFHHAIYDGRTVGATARSEWAQLFRHLAGIV